MSLYTATGQNASTGISSSFKYSYHSSNFEDKFEVINRTNGSNDQFLLIGNDILAKFGYFGVDYIDGYVILNDAGLKMSNKIPKVVVSMIKDSQSNEHIESSDQKMVKLVQSTFHECMKEYSSEFKQIIQSELQSFLDGGITE